MCGIFALFLKRPLTEADIALGRAGVAALGHRGPDGHGEWIDRQAGVYLGHRRLAIIDTSAANAQPMVRDGGAIAYNGELYNFPAIKRELEASGESFSTSGDVEVLLRALQRWGPGAFDRLDGMFALAYWDGAAATLAVDPFGEKPLLWAEQREGIYVASEIQPLVRLLGLEPRLTEELLAAYLALGYIPAPRTSYPSLRRLEAATSLRIRDGVAGEARRYWTPPIGSPARRPARPLDERAIDRLRDALLDSLKGRLIADVPMCCFLSSGVDSSLVAAMAKRDLDTDLECVTVAFPGAPLDDEAPMAAETARHLGLVHRRVVSNADPEQSRAADVLELFGQPCDATTALSIQQMTQVVAADFKVGLTGSGGDEITFGYGKHVHFNRFRGLYGLPETVRLAMGYAARAARPLSRRLDRIGFDIGTRDWERYIAQKNYPAIDWLRRLPAFSAWCHGRFDHGEPSLELAVPGYEIADVMPNSRLISMDLGSMRSSVELRTPFLSRQVVETVAEFDPRAMIAFGQKSVLRRLLTRYLPRDLVARPKRGFVFPAHYLIAAYGGRPPAVPGVAASLAEDVWRRLPEGKGWLRLAVRLALLHEFLDSGGAPESRAETGVRASS